MTTQGDDRDDRALLAAHVAGDPAAFGTLFARHRDRLWAVALRTTGDREEAADALQDAMVAAFRRAESFRGEAAVTTWLHRIVVNACLDRARRRAVRPAEPLPEHDTLQVADRHDDVAARTTALDVTAALATLPIEQRGALVLVDMYGWSDEDAAEALDCPVGTVKSRCARGRARLLPLLRERNQEPGPDVPPPNAATTVPTPPTTPETPREA